MTKLLNLTIKIDKNNKYQNATTSIDPRKIIYGINCSRQAEERSGSSSLISHISTGDAGVAIRGPMSLKSEINRTNNQLGGKR